MDGGIFLLCTSSEKNRKIFYWIVAWPAGYHEPLLYERTHKVDCVMLQAVQIRPDSGHVFIHQWASLRHLSVAYLRR